MKVRHRQELMLPVCLMIAAVPAVAVAPVRIAYAGRVTTTPAPVVRLTGGTLVPLRSAAEALGGLVSWNAAAQMASVRHGERVLEVEQRTNMVRLNGQPLVPGVAPRTARGHLLVPMSSMERLFDVRGRWLPRQNTLRFAAASDGGAGHDGGAPPQSGAAGVQLRLTSQKRGYAIKEPVQLTFTVTNPARSAVTLNFSSGQLYDIEVRHAGRTVVWSWSAGRFFTQALTELTLGPGERRNFSVTWNQQDNEGQSVAPGAYTAVATLTTMGRPRPQTQPLAFRIGG
jgi:hypothetical protein